MTQESQRPLLILVAGPYRSGTNDDPALLRANHQAMQRAALELFRAGHIGLTGEDIALPLAALAGSERVGDTAFNAIFHPVGRLLAERCDAVLRIGGASVGADEMVEVARRHGRQVFSDLAQIPVVRTVAEESTASFGQVG